jgi:predicted kinase
VSTLYLTRGLPGSGKTTKARAWVAEAPERRVRVNRDDLRAMAHGGRVGADWQEDAVTVVQRAAVAALLVGGYDVVIDDTNLRPSVFDAWCELGADEGDLVAVWDLTNVPLEPAWHGTSSAPARRRTSRRRRSGACGRGTSSR